MAIIIDFNGFRESSEGFIIKELAGIYLNFEGESSDQLSYFIFSSPYSSEYLSSDYREHNKWCEQNHHGIPWEAGDIAFAEIGNVLEVLLHKVECIYVKGKNKKLWLTKMIAATKIIIDLADIGCHGVAEVLEHPPTHYHSDFHPKCRDYVCAYENVQRMKKWFVRNVSLSPSIEKSIRLFSVIRGLKGMLAEDIALLPKELIINFARDDIHGSWHKLSLEQKSDKTLASYQRCLKHNRYITQHQDVCGGVYPYKRFCDECMGEDEETFEILKRFGLSQAVYVRLLARMKNENL